MLPGTILITEKIKSAFAKKTKVAANNELEQKTLELEMRHSNIDPNDEYTCYDCYFTEYKKYQRTIEKFNKLLKALGNEQKWKYEGRMAVVNMEMSERVRYFHDHTQMIATFIREKIIDKINAL